jgi:uncharacterized protein DUF2865
MDLRIVLATVLLLVATRWLSAEAQYFRAGPFAGAFRSAPYGSPRGVDFPKAFSSPYAYPGYRPDPAAPTAGATYRTLCVRLCDGFYFPISYAVPASGLGRDAEQCRASCGPEARLFYHPSPGGSAENMVDLSGRAYSALPTAFTYRKTLVAGCSCRPQAVPSQTAAAAAESMAKTRVLEPPSSVMVDNPLSLEAEPALVRPEPIVRDFSDPAWASSPVRD